MADGEKAKWNETLSDTISELKMVREDLQRRQFGAHVATLNDAIAVLEDAKTKILGIF